MSDRRAYRVTGRVQGVGFRWWTRQAARELGLRGVVRNERDGSVFVEAAGTADALARLEGRLAQGPPGAVVTAVAPLQAGGDPLPAGFEIAR